MARPAAVIVLAAGQGTRMKSRLPKVVHPVAGLSMIGHALRAAVGVDPDDVVAVVRHQRDVVAAEILRVLPSAIVADQDEVPGTGRAVQCGLAALDGARGAVHGTVLVTYGDVPLLSSQTLARLVGAHEASGDAVTVLTSRVEDPTGYGRILRAPDGSVAAIVEQRDATAEQALITEINAGIYAFDADFLRGALAGLGTDNDQGEVYLTDALAAAARSDGRRERPRPVGGAGGRVQPPHLRGAHARGCHHHRPRLHVDRRRRGHRRRHDDPSGNRPPRGDKYC